MGWIFANQWRRLKDTYLIIISGCYLARICWTVQTTNADVVVYRTRDDLHPFKCAGQYHNIASSRISLNTDRRWVMCCGPFSGSEVEYSRWMERLPRCRRRNTGRQHYRHHSVFDGSSCRLPPKLWTWPT